VVSWLGQELFDLLAGEDPARLGLEVEGQRVGMETWMAAGQDLQLPPQFWPVHAASLSSATRLRTAWAC
jgi:hypothetical protein